MPALFDLENRVLHDFGSDVVVSLRNLGEAREEMDVDYAGETLSVGFNARYILDALASMRTKEIQLAFESNLSPATITPSDDDETLAVVMPMRI